MTIKKLFGDNPVNKAEVNVIETWADHHNEKINHLTIGKLWVRAITESGRVLKVIRTDTNYSIRTASKYLELYEEVNNKWVRIKKANW